jgi:hypothetical protein
MKAQHTKVKVLVNDAMRGNSVVWVFCTASDIATEQG